MHSKIAILAVAVALAGCAHKPLPDASHHRHMATKAVAEPSRAIVASPLPDVIVPQVTVPPPTPPVVAAPVVAPKLTRRARLKAYLKSRHILP